MRSAQHAFFDESVPPGGFRYWPDLIRRDLEELLVAQFQTLPFRNFEFHGFLGKRRVVSYGWRYDFSARAVQRVSDIPEFLLPVRELAAQFAGIEPEALQQVLVTEYEAGASIGWHRDKAVFGEVIGISILSPCTFRLRRERASGWERYAIVAEPRSAYLLSGAARTEWEHSIPAVDALRYSVTLRTFAQRAPAQSA